MDTSTFTAPVAGVYYFSTSFTVWAGEWANFEIAVNGEALCRAHGGGWDFPHTSCSGVAALEEGKRRTRVLGCLHHPLHTHTHSHTHTHARTHIRNAEGKTGTTVHDLQHPLHTSTLAHTHAFGTKHLITRFSTSSTPATERNLPSK